ncbi:MAG: ABC transporter permease subunit [Deltaproteobacteria bacterium]|nr:ABC transporter permease subunit [Deltaproteobacteria bacterium]
MKKIFNTPLATIALFEFYENIRNKWLLIYALSFLLFSGIITYIGASDPLQASASLLNLVLLLVPLFSLVFGSLSFAESLPFHEMLVSLPISRRDIFLGKWIGLGVGLSLSFLLGMGLGSLLQMNLSQTGFGSYTLLLLLGVLLTFVFLSIAFWVVNVVRKKELVFGWMLLLWFFFFILYDALVFGVVLLFGDYPLEGPMLLMTFLNPIDLSRVILLLKIDLSAMMGYSGALFQKYLGNFFGMALGLTALGLWIFIPTFFGLKRFQKRDL